MAYVYQAAYCKNTSILSCHVFKFLTSSEMKRYHSGVLYDEDGQPDHGDGGKYMANHGLYQPGDQQPSVLLKLKIS